MRKALKLTVLIILSIGIICLGIYLYLKPRTTGLSMNLSNLNYSNSEKYTQESTGLVFDVSNLEINWVAGTVEIRTYEGLGVSFEETSNQEIPSQDRLCYWQDGDTLKIEYTTAGPRNLTVRQKKLVVNVPEELIQENIKVSVISADANIYNIAATNADFSAVSGDYHLYNFKSKEIKVDTVSGSFYAENLEFEDLIGEAVSGDIDFAITSVPQKIDLNTVSGSITLSLPQQAGFELTTSTVSGDLSCQTEAKILSKNKMIRGSEDIEIKLQTVSGDMELK